MSAIEYWLWLSAELNVSSKAKAALIEHYGDAESAFYAPEGEYSTIRGISSREAEILEKRNISRSAGIIERCEDLGLDIISMQDSAYPNRLRNIYAPPVVLYVKGRMPDIDSRAVVAVIGTRKASPYGLKMGRELSWQICQCQGIVVSMINGGIDAAAARGALLAGGKCIGVLGCSHDQAGGRLCEDIAQRGALISEYPPGSRTMRGFFRDRNRIAAGISLGVVVVEAPEKSGTRLFADEAAEQGKEIFAVPGNADAAACAGSNALIKEGAKLVTHGAEVMAEFEPLYPDAVKIRIKDCPPEPSAMPEKKKAEPQKEKAEPRTEKTEPRREKTEPQKEKVIDKEKSREYISLREQLSSLTEEQLKIVTAIDKNAVHIDDIIETTGLPASRVLAQLTVLEIRGYVRRQAGRRILLNIAKK